MSEEKDNGFRAQFALLITATDLGNGKCRLTFDDLVNEKESTDHYWKHDRRFIFKDYDLKTLNNFEISKNEYAEIGKIFVTHAQALNLKKVNREELISEIRDAFEDVEFPYHMGLIAAEEVDNWVNDKDILRKLTEQRDFHGPWWEIPESHLTRGSLGLNYLDSTGMAFYLPAFMTLALRKPELKNISPLVFELNPVYEENESDLFELFCDKLSKIQGKRKEVCVKFLYYMKEVLLLQGYPQIYDVQDINMALQHDFWRSE